MKFRLGVVVGTNRDLEQELLSKFSGRNRLISPQAKIGRRLCCLN
jgi:hypothetical protein